MEFSVKIKVTNTQLPMILIWFGEIEYRSPCWSGLHYMVWSNRINSAVSYVKSILTRRNLCLKPRYDVYRTSKFSHYLDAQGSGTRLCWFQLKESLSHRVLPIHSTTHVSFTPLGPHRISPLLQYLQYCGVLFSHHNVRSISSKFTRDLNNSGSTVPLNQLSPVVGSRVSFSSCSTFVASLSPYYVGTWC